MTYHTDFAAVGWGSFRGFCIGLLAILFFLHSIDIAYYVSDVYLDRSRLYRLLLWIGVLLGFLALPTPIALLIYFSIIGVIISEPFFIANSSKGGGIKNSSMYPDMISQYLYQKEGDIVFLFLYLLVIGANIGTWVISGATIEGLLFFLAIMLFVLFIYLHTRSRGRSNSSDISDILAWLLKINKCLLLSDIQQLKNKFQSRQENSSAGLLLSQFGELFTDDGETSDDESFHDDPDLSPRGPGEVGSSAATNRSNTDSNRAKEPTPSARHTVDSTPVPDMATKGVMNSDSSGTKIFSEPESDHETTVRSHCPNCGGPILVYSNFCGECGTPIIDDTEVVLVFDGKSITVSFGEPIGARLRSTLVNAGYHETQALQISRNHIEFKREGAEVYVRELDSTHGTTLEGVELQSNQWQKIDNGMTLGLGDVVTMKVFFTGQS